MWEFRDFLSLRIFLCIAILLIFWKINSCLQHSRSNRKTFWYVGSSEEYDTYISDYERRKYVNLIFWDFLEYWKVKKMKRLEHVLKLLKRDFKRIFCFHSIIFIDGKIMSICLSFLIFQVLRILRIVRF